MTAPDKIYVEVCEDGIFAFPKPPFKESVEYIRTDIVGQSLHQEQPLLPANLDDAAEEYGNKEFPDEPALGQWGTGDYEPPVDNEYPREIAKDAFIAGVEWMTGQGASFNTKVGWIDGPTILDWPDDILDKFEMGDEVIVQIRKKGKD